MVKIVYKHLMLCAKCVGICTFLGEESYILNQILTVGQDPKYREPRKEYVLVYLAALTKIL